VDPIAGLDDVEKRKFLILPGLELRPLGFQPVASRYIDSYWFQLLMIVDEFGRSGCLRQGN
jgi:hypothetical protein